MMGVLVVAVMFIVGIVAAAVWLGSSSVTEAPAAAAAAPDPYAVDRSGMGYVKCQDAVRNRLKAPTSAHFVGGLTPPPLPHYAAGNGTQSYTFNGLVDAQNSYGAILRTSYTCTATYDVNLGTWGTTARIEGGRA